MAGHPGPGAEPAAGHRAIHRTLLPARASAGLRLALTAPDMPPVDGSDELLRRLDVDELAAIWEGRPLQLKDIEAIGDHLPGARLRYADFFAALAAPITRASGQRQVVLARAVGNRRLSTACHLWAFAALTGSVGARRYYDAHRARGATHHQALRALANRLVGILHGCLRHRQAYDEQLAWPTPRSRRGAKEVGRRSGLPPKAAPGPTCFGGAP